MQAEQVGRSKRTLSLIANFKDGFADGWHFAVGECFRDQLDIRLTPRVEPVIIDGQVQYTTVSKNGKVRRVRQTQTVHRWTQGIIHSFAKGDVIYDSRKAKKLSWGDSLKIIALACHVSEAIPDTLDDNGRRNPGFVQFELLEPNERQDGLRLVGQHLYMQHEFVKFLKTGKLLDVPETTDAATDTEMQQTELTL